MTDVEQEHNGLYYYDRRPKFDLKRICRHHLAQGGLRARRADRPTPDASGHDRLEGSRRRQQDGKLSTPWRYVVKTPEGDWTAAQFDDAAWPSALAPFGHDPGWPTKTPWTTSDIYLRKTFEYDGGDLNAAAIVISYDEDTEVFVNGQKILSTQNYVGHYEMHAVTAALKKALHQAQTPSRFTRTRRSAASTSIWRCCASSGEILFGIRSKTPRDCCLGAGPSRSGM